MRSELKNALYLTTGFVAALFPSLANAQDGGSDLIETAPITMELPGDLIVITASGVPQAEWKSGQSISIIDSTVIERAQKTDVASLLERVPGVTLARNGSQGGITTVFMRGAEGGQTLTLIDGMRVNDPSGTNGAFDFGNLLTSGVSRIEVLRGSNSVVWGSDAMGGVINVTTEPPSNDTTGKVAAEYGSENTYSLTGTVGATIGPIALSLSAGHFNTDGFSSAASGTEDDGFRQTMATGRVRVELGGAGTLRLNGYYGDGKLDLDGYPAPYYSFADTNEYGKTRQLAGQVSHEITLFDVLTSRLSYAISDINRDNYDPDNAYVADHQIFRSSGTTERFSWTADAKLGGGFTLIGGLAREKSRFHAVDNVYFSDESGKARIDSVHGLLNWSPSPRFAISAGVRHDDHQTFGGHTTFGANGRFQVSDNGPILRASYGEGFKAPTLYQLHSAYGNTALTPETSRSFDIGIEQRIRVPGSYDLGATFAVTYFNRKTQNQIDFVSCWGVTGDANCTSRPYGGYYDNIAATRAQGIEVEIGIQPAEGVDLSAVYSYIDTENRSAGGANFGNDLARRPRHAFTFSADAKVIAGLSLGGDVRLVGDSFDNAANSVRLDGYAVANIRARYDFSDTIALTGRVDNLFDQHYQTVGGYGTAGRGAFIGLRAGF